VPIFFDLAAYFDGFPILLTFAVVAAIALTASAFVMSERTQRQVRQTSYILPGPARSTRLSDICAASGISGTTMGRPIKVDHGFSAKGCA
jgi:hypothetical protein